MKRLLPLLPLGFLWFTLINQLRVEWTVNPQYTYGWVVPVLCAGLAWKRWSGSLEPGTQDPAPRVTGCPLSGPAGALRALRPWLFAFCAFLYAPTRLIQEANPEWRLVSWLLALEVVGLTLLVLGQMSVVRSQKSEPTADLRPLSSVLWFPLCFFLVAVPWPTLIEGPLIQGLTRADAGIVTEALGWLGLPAVQQGNVIQVSAGTVGIDEACSGIRSFQSSLMISLFLGELHRLALLRRAVLCLSGFLLAFGFNGVRTFLLAWLAATKGMAAIASWHDPAGFSILVACVAALWLLSKRLSGNNTIQMDGERSRPGCCAARPRAEQDDVTGCQTTPCVASAGRRARAPSGLTGGHRGQGAWLRAPHSMLLALAVWLVVVETGVAAWYRVRESRLPRSAEWTVRAPRDEPEFTELPLSDKTRQFLRYDEALQCSWREGNARWQMIFLRWQPGRIAVHLAKGHTPETCLPAAGRRLISASDLKPFQVQALQLPFRSYVVEEQGRPVHVFYCLWEDRAEEQSFQAEGLTYGNRLGPVLAGRRNPGERSLEIAVWGISDAQAAEAAVARELEAVIRVAR